jgi:hypothetical protein
MQLSNEVLIGTDGWFEYEAAAPTETADIPVFGWLDFAASDTILVPSTGKIGGGNQTMEYRRTKKRVIGR